MRNKESSITGSDALIALESAASAELKRVRQLVEQAVESDISAYLNSIGAGVPLPNVLAGLCTAAIAGGQLGFSNLVTRLGDTSLKIKDADSAANNILSLVHRHTSILNNIRLKTSVVQSITKTLLGKSLAHSHKMELTQILDYRLFDQASLSEWGENAEELFQKQATVTGQVSNRSISTYSKLWKSYLNEKILPMLGVRTNIGKVDFVSERLRPLINYKEPSSNQINKLLDESIKKFKFISAPKPSNYQVKSSKLIYRKDLGGRLLKITYNSPGIDPELIQPVISSVKGQMLADPTQTKISVDMSNEVSQVILELEHPKKEDLVTLKIHLGSIAYGL